MAKRSGKKVGEQSDAAEGTQVAVAMSVEEALAAADTERGDTLVELDRWAAASAAGQHVDGPSVAALLKRSGLPVDHWRAMVARHASRIEAAGLIVLAERRQEASRHAEQELADAVRERDEAMAAFERQIAEKRDAAERAAAEVIRIDGAREILRKTASADLRHAHAAAQLNVSRIREAIKALNREADEVGKTLIGLKRQREAFGAHTTSAIKLDAQIDQAEKERDAIDAQIAQAKEDGVRATEELAEAARRLEQPTRDEIAAATTPTCSEQNS